MMELPGYCFDGGKNFYPIICLQYTISEVTEHHQLKAILISHITTLYYLHTVQYKVMQSTFPLSAKFDQISGCLAISASLSLFR